MYVGEITTRQRGEAFDHMVAQTEVALRDPAFVETIGNALASELLEINSRFFLPDVRHGQAIIPPSQKGTDNPILLPWSGEEAKTHDHMLDVVGMAMVKHWFIDRATYSSTYDITLTSADIDEFEATKPSPEEVDEMHSNSAFFVTNGAFRLNNGVFSISRPIVTAQYWDTKPEHLSACVAHETVHVLDTYTDGPVNLSSKHQIGSEYRAYHVDYAVGGDELVGEGNMLPQKVEMFRQEHADPARPFHPTPAMVAKAVELGIV